MDKLVFNIGKVTPNPSSLSVSGDMTANTTITGRHSELVKGGGDNFTYDFEDCYKYPLQDSRM
jgi:hypothetical protein